MALYATLGDGYSRFKRLFAPLAFERKVRMRGLNCAALAALCILIPWSGHCTAAPKTIGFMGRLTDPTGVPTPDADYSVALALYTVPTGGAAVWTDTKSVHVTRGLFSTALGDTSGDPLPADFSVAYFVGVKFGTDPEMAPRVPLQGVPYALFAESVADNSVTSSKLASDAGSLAKATAGSMLVAAGGNVGVGVTNPQVNLDVLSSTVGGGIHITGVAPNGPILGLTELDATGTIYSRRGFLGLALMDGQWSDDAVNGDIVLRTNNKLIFQNGSAGSAMVISGNNVGIGTGTSAISAPLEVHGDIRLGSTGQFQAVAGSGALRIVSGSVNANGTSAGLGFTSTRIGLGRYRITFNTAFSGNVNTTATGTSPTTYVYITIVGETQSQVDIDTFNGSGASADEPFDFNSIGPR